MIVALDPSTKVIGWALMDDEQVYDYGAIQIEGDGLDEKLDDLRCKVADLMVSLFGYQDDSLELCGIEMPVLHRRHSKQNVHTLKVLAQVVGAIRCTIYPWAYEVLEIIPSQRLLALGLPARMKRADAKAAVLRNVNQIYGLELSSKEHDTADAIAVGRAGLLKAAEDRLTGGD